jgi:hypothetical protein
VLPCWARGRGGGGVDGSDEKTAEAEANSEDSEDGAVDQDGGVADTSK